MKAILPGLIAILGSFLSAAQTSPIIYGEIPLKDLKMTVYDKDSSASAVVLEEYGEAAVATTSFSATMTFEQHRRIKILTKEGLALANTMIKFYDSDGISARLSKLRATTHNLENGRIVSTDVGKENVSVKRLDRYYNCHEFTFPNVKVGSVIEFSYTMRTDELYWFPNWRFQDTIPVRHSEYWAMFPEFFSFEKFMKGYRSPDLYEVKPKTNAHFQMKAHHWLSKDVPAFKVEPFISCPDNYVSEIDLWVSHINYPSGVVREVMGSWEKLNERLLDYPHFGMVMRGSGFLKKKAEELTVGIKDPSQKITAIFNYVRETMEWDGVNDPLSDNPKAAYERRKGTAADINLILAAMLNHINMPVDLLLLSTREHGFVRRQFPTPQQFNYVVCRTFLGDKTILLDATDKYLPMGILPERCLNGEGLLISKERHGWMTLEPKVKGRTAINSELLLTETGTLKGKVNYTYEGYDAATMRRDYFAKSEQEYVKDFLSGKPWDIESLEFKNLKDKDHDPLQEQRVSIHEYATVANGGIYFNPMFAEQVKENLFKAVDREYPVDFGKPFEKTLMCSVVLPAGYNVEQLPAAKVIKLPNNDARYTYTVTQAGDRINLVSILQVNKSMFVQTEYAQLREFYNQVVAKQAEQIVLRKK